MAEEHDLSMMENLYWWGIPTLFRCPQDKLETADIALVGVPHSTGNGTTERDQHLGPRAVRNVSALQRRTHGDFKIDPWNEAKIIDAGDVPFPRANDNEDCIERITKFFTEIDEAKIKNLSAPLINRLILDQKKVDALVSTVESIAQMPDPLGQILDEWSQPNGLSFKKITVPLGVIGIIYESRPNVTVDAAALCLRSGNIPILRGGKECINSNTALYNCIQEALTCLLYTSDAADE